MVSDKINIKRALLSVSNKNGIIEFAKALIQFDIELISTGGTSQLLRSANLPVTDVSDITGFPEMMDGRVKTLHPKIHGGILGQRDQHEDIAKKYSIDWIDLVIVNLYPFADIIKNPEATWSDVIENIDIGGPTLLRAAAKNMNWVTVVTDPSDYASILSALNSDEGITLEKRQALAIKAFGHTADYDHTIHHYLTSHNENKFPEQIHLRLEKFSELRYGENPHQAACAYKFTQQSSGILFAKQHQGKPLSYNNIADADAAVACVSEFNSPACVIVKHNNPCGVATSDSIEEAFKQAYLADSLSAYGGIIALNRPCNEYIAESLADIFIEVLIAPGYTSQALSMLAKKTNLRVLEFNLKERLSQNQELKFINGGILVQEKDRHVLQKDDLQMVSTRQPSETDLNTLLFAWGVLKHVKSNAILIAKNNATVGIGAGQVSRIESVNIALKKAGKNLIDTVLASDAFFPFRDSIDHIAGSGIRAIIQPGGSVRDQEVIAACNEHNIAMVFTNMRCFKH